MQGLMQDWPLTVDRIIDHAARWHGTREVVARTLEGPIVRETYAEVRRRAKPTAEAHARFVGGDLCLKSRWRRSMARRVALSRVRCGFESRRR